MLPDESCIDRKYRLLLFKTCTSEPTIIKLGLNTKWQLECPLCGARKSHLVWLPHRRTWKFLCSTKSRANCQSQMEFPVLLRAWCPDLFLSYQQERFEAGTTGARFNCPQPLPSTRRRPPVNLSGSRSQQDQNQVAGIGTIAS